MNAASHPHERSRLYARRRRWLPLLTATLGSLLLVHLFGRMPVEISGFLLEVGVRLDTSPKTRLFIPPVGEIRAATHWALVSLEVVLWNIDMETVRRLTFWNSVAEVARGGPSSLALVESVFSQAVKGIALRLLGLTVALGFLGGSLGSLLGGSPRTLRRWMGGGVLGLILTLSLLLPAYVTYDPAAFERAEYQGIIEAAPWMIQAVRESVGQVEALGTQLQTVAGNLYALFHRLDQLEALGLPPADLVVLHVSDLHNSPAGLDFVDEVARRFNADFIIDTGDITDWGTHLEAELIQRIRELERPYLVVPGNHESPLVLERLRQTPNVRLLEDELVSVMGLRIFGFADPNAYQESPRHLTPQQAAALSETITQQVQALPPGSVDIIAVHNHRVARRLPEGLAQAVLFGHDHRLAVDASRRPVLINAGTTGAAGIRGLQGPDPVPYSLAILYFSREPQTAAREAESSRAPTQPGSALTPLARQGEASGGEEPDSSEAAAPASRLRLAVVDTVRVYTLPARALTLERLVIERQGDG